MKRHFDELVSDERLEDAESRFRVEVFNGTLDIVLAKLTERFASLRRTVADFNAIKSCTLCNATDQVLFQEAAKLTTMYKDDLTANFPEQLLSFRACLREQLTHVKSLKQLANLPIVDNQCISSNFGEVCTALVLF